MAFMSTEIAVLRALLQLSHRRTPATLDDVVARIRAADEREVLHSLASLARAQLVLRSGVTMRLSLAGLAVAVAATSHAKAAAKARLRSVAADRTSARVVSLDARPRRHRAA